MKQLRITFLLSTGNRWQDRKNFVKHPNKFYPLEIDYGQDDEELKSTIAPGSKSLLPTPIQELIKMIFDVESMKKTLVEFEVRERKRQLSYLHEANKEWRSCFHDQIDVFSTILPKFVSEKRS